MYGDIGLCGDWLCWRLLIELGELLRGLYLFGECLKSRSSFSRDGGLGFAEIPGPPGFPMCMRFGSVPWVWFVVSFSVAVL